MACREPDKSNNTIATSSCGEPQAAHPEAEGGSKERHAEGPAGMPAARLGGRMATCRCCHAGGHYARPCACRHMCQQAIRARVGGAGSLVMSAGEGRPRPGDTIDPQHPPRPLRRRWSRARARKKFPHSYPGKPGSQNSGAPCGRWGRRLVGSTPFRSTGRPMKYLVFHLQSPPRRLCPHLLKGPDATRNTSRGGSCRHTCDN